MAQTPPLSLSNIVDITVQVEASTPAVNTFNVGLFIAASAIIPSYGANSRIRFYTSLTAVLTDGFITSDPEYIAAQIYFSNGATELAIGRQDLTAIGTATVDAGGTGWKVGDQFTIAQVGGNYGVGQVTAVNAGAVTTFVLITQGTGYSVAAGLVCTAVSPATGTGLTVTIATIGESLEQAAIACRSASALWYGLTVYNPVDADNTALSQWADPQWQTTRYYPFSNDSAIPAATASNLALQLQAQNLRVLGQYATTQSGLYPNNIYAAVALMGCEMGLNSGLANSFFTVAHKTLVGIAPEPLTQTQYQNILAAGFNVYCNFSPYEMEEPGFMSNGSPSYLWLNLAMLVSRMQNNAISVLQRSPAVPQTNAGEHLLLQAENEACDEMVAVGFIAGGTWKGLSVNIPGVQLANGQALPSGYVNLAQPYSQQSPTDRAAGKAMPIYTFITTAGAVQSLAIQVNVQL